MSKSDGSTADYYELPEGAKELQDLISFRNMNAQLGEMFRACYRYGLADHSDRTRDLKKIIFYAQAELTRIEKYDRPPAFKISMEDLLRPGPLVIGPGVMDLDKQISAAEVEARREAAVSKMGAELKAATDGLVEGLLYGANAITEKSLRKRATHPYTSLPGCYRSWRKCDEECVHCIIAPECSNATKQRKPT